MRTSQRMMEWMDCPQIEGLFRPWKTMVEVTGRSDKDWARYGADKTKKASKMGVICNKELLLEIKMRSE
ncbi:hypothetical protein SERLA73DRAFT_184625 [Serpula lacrymans var. lacrymans S7.3]|uniref:Uncharacterized protein n=1 Tax=Serpula lacrymans var. lacrymans (strain S7.3) TaxID=936435 RepID=F8Q4R3_SERL3|nr:hypothetical protein SERLA73DRAFT_184625 [Serpula lacrymans var. lacrymans S7.3]